MAERAPAIAAEVTQVMVDNPGTMLTIGAGTIVATRIAVRAMRPRSGLEALALLLLLQLTLPKLAQAAMDRGWLPFRVRDCDGRLVPMVRGKVEADVAPAP